MFTTDLHAKNVELLRIPFWLLTLDDLCLLLNVSNQLQIPIIEKALKLVGYFAQEEDKVIKQKNDIIARCLLNIIYGEKNQLK